MLNKLLNKNVYIFSPKYRLIFVNIYVDYKFRKSLAKSLAELAEMMLNPVINYVFIF